MDAHVSLRTAVCKCKNCLITFHVAVEGVMSRVPIKMMSTVLDIRPYTSLIQGDGHLETLEVRNLPKDLTDELLTMHIENALEATEMSSTEYKCRYLIHVYCTPM